MLDAYSPPPEDSMFDIQSVYFSGQAKFHTRDLITETRLQGRTNFSFGCNLLKNDGGQVGRHVAIKQINYSTFFRGYDDKFEY